MGAILGFLLHAIGGLCAGSFYTPIKKITTWAWESSWLVMGVAAWLITPNVVSALTVNDFWSVISEAPSSAIFWAYFFGFLWGAGGPIFGLTMRYLGVSLGMTVSLGSGAVFGTLMPPIVDGTFSELLQSTSGIITLSGVGICLIGIAFAAYAGHQRDVQKAESNATGESFNIGKGILITFLSGPLGASFAYGLAAGKPIADLAVDHGTASLWQNSAVLSVILIGGLTSNFILCVFNNIRNKTGGDYLKKQPDQMKNYALAALGGVTWYLQFMFYGMGTSFLDEDFHFASWTIHMSFIIIFGNLWGLYFKEWKGIKRQTVAILVIGLIILISSTAIIAIGGAS